MMNKETYALVKQCINTSRNISYVFSLPHNRWAIAKGDIKLFDTQLNQLLKLIKDAYPYLHNELDIATTKFNTNIPHCFGAIDCILSILEQEGSNSQEYVNADRIVELQSVNNVNFDLTKLVQFCKELNIAYNSKAYLAVPLIVRAIIDHIPPIFGKKNFAEVAGGHGSKSFQASMNHLDNTSRKIADGIIHTQIRNKEVLPNETQINFKADLDVLLAEIFRILKK